MIKRKETKKQNQNRFLENENWKIEQRYTFQNIQLK
jgi:hypothetical protein